MELACRINLILLAHRSQASHSPQMVTPAQHRSRSLSQVQSPIPKGPLSSKLVTTLQHCGSLCLAHLSASLSPHQFPYRAAKHASLTQHNARITMVWSQKGDWEGALTASIFCPVLTIFSSYQWDALLRYHSSWSKVSCSSYILKVGLSPFRQ